SVPAPLPASSSPLMIPPPPTSTPFPYTTLFRSPAFSDVSGHGVGQAPGGGASPEAFIDAVDAIQRLASHLDREAGGPLSTSLLRSEEHTSELQSRENLVCRLLLEKKKKHILLPS